MSWEDYSVSCNVGLKCPILYELFQLMVNGAVTP